MAMRSPRSPAVSEKYQTGCMWSSISIFNFRQGHVNRKLLSNGRCSSRSPDASGLSKGRLDLLTILAEKDVDINNRVGKKPLTRDAGKARVKKSTRQHLKKQIISPEVDHEHSYSELFRHVPKDHASLKAFQAHDHDHRYALMKSHQSNSLLGDKSSVVVDLAAVAETFSNQTHLKNVRDNSDMKKNVGCVKCRQLNEISPELVHTSEAAEAFIDQKVIDERFLSRDAANHQSKQLLDALTILNSNRELFMKLLQDPNSLLVKHIQDFGHSQKQKEPMKSLSEAKISEHGIGSALQCGEPVCSQKFQNQNVHNFFWKKIESGEDNPLKGSECPQPSDGVEVLKPSLISMNDAVSRSSHCNSPKSLETLKNKGHGAKPAKFFFGKAKPKLKTTIGEGKEEQQWTSAKNGSHRFPIGHKDSEEGSKSTGGSNPPTKAYRDSDGVPKFLTDVEQRKKTGKPQTFESSSRHGVASTSEFGGKILNSSFLLHPKQRESDIYVEAKKHIAEMLTNGYKDEYFTKQPASRTLGRILSLPAYEFRPARNPGTDRIHDLIDAQMGISSCSNFQGAKKDNLPFQHEEKASCLCSLGKNVEFLPRNDDKKSSNQFCVSGSEYDVSGKHFPLTREYEIIQPVRDYSSPMQLRCPGDSNILEVSLDPNCTPVTRTQQIDTVNMCEGSGHLEDLILDLNLENRPSSSSSLDFSSSRSSIIQKVEDSNSIKDKLEQPSPVSVLEPFFSDNVSSPISTMCKDAQLPMEPLPIRFEENCHMLEASHLDPEINFSTCVQNPESMYEYVRAVLQAADLYQDEFSVKCNLSGQLPAQCLFDEVELLPMQSYDDRKLLCDCTDEVLLEVYRHFFGCCPWVSSVKPMYLPVLIEKSLVHEVIKGVNWYLLRPQAPQTLEQLIGKDLAKSGTWLDTRFDTEDIVVEIVQAVVEDLLEENIYELQTSSTICSLLSSNWKQEIRTEGGR